MIAAESVQRAEEKAFGFWLYLMSDDLDDLGKDPPKAWSVHNPLQGVTASSLLGFLD